MAFFASNCNAQKIDRYVIAASGEILNSGDYTLQFTIGESYAQTVYDGGQLTQGFEQEWAVVTAVEDAEVEPLFVNVYPNLTPGILNIEVHEPAVASIFDLYGHMLKSWTLESGRISVQIDELPSGMYIIVFKSEQGNRVSSVKVNKVRS
jgi:5-hydroxyisourate hydrolase-like protein (transthyretin family)